MVLANSGKLKRLREAGMLERIYYIKVKPTNSVPWEGLEENGLTEKLCGVFHRPG